VIAFIDDHRDRFGVEPICRVLTEHAVQVAPSGYYAFKQRGPSARALRDVQVLEHIRRVFNDRRLGRRVYGARKVWNQLNREGVLVEGKPIARCTVERLMRADGLAGVVRGRRVITTVADLAAPRPADLVKRDFTAEAPNRLWIVDFTYVPTWSGMCFTAFVTDAFSRRIVGWRVKASMPTELPLDALEMALWVRQRAGQDLDGLVHHSDAGSQYTSIRYTERLAEAGARPSIGSVGDSYDNAMAESIIGLFKTEVIRRRGPWRGLDDVEIATLEWVDWFNNRRLFEALGNIPPAEAEANHYRTDVSPEHPKLSEPSLY